MKRRKKPRPSSQVRDRYPVEKSGLYPYLLRFLEWFAARGTSPRTIDLRADALKRFIRWCDERGITRPQEVSRPILERYRRHLYHYRKDNGEPLSFATQQQRLIPLRGYFRWLARENYIPANPASELELPRVRRRLPAHILSPEQIEAAMAQALRHGELALRDRALLETLYSTGIRRSELINLKLYDLDLKNGALMVRQGKGLNRTGIPGDFNLREDGVYGNSKAVFKGSSGSSRPASFGAARRARLAVGSDPVGGWQDGLHGAVAASLGGTGRA
jgi:integrase/recombinase XerD